MLEQSTGRTSLKRSGLGNLANPPDSDQYRSDRQLKRSSKSAYCNRVMRRHGTTNRSNQRISNCPCKVVKVDSEHISTAHIEWPEGKQSSESCGCRRSHLIILDVVVVERKEVRGFCGFNYRTQKQTSAAVLPPAILPFRSRPELSARPFSALSNSI